MAEQTGETIVSVPFQGHTIDIACVERIEHQLDQVGAKLWPTGLALSMYLVSVYGEDFFRGKSVIDLGSGVGLLGLALAKLGANVTFTDADESIAPGVLALLQTNVKANLPHSDIHVQAYNWGQALPDNMHVPYDIVVGADVIYQKVVVPLLLEAIRAVSGPESLIFMVFQEHNLEAVEAFSELLPRNQLSATEISRRKIARVCGEHHRPDMHIVKLKLEPEGTAPRVMHIEFVRLATLFDSSGAEDEGSDEATDEEL